GGMRRGVVVDDGRQRFVGPDNGVFALAVPAPQAAYEIAAPTFRRASVASTFHGRDMFAPAAARLAAGARPEEAGPAVTLAGALPRKAIGLDRGGRRIVGHVVHVDRFGNLVTDIPAARLPEGARIQAGRFSVRGLQRTYE